MTDDEIGIAQTKAPVLICFGTRVSFTKESVGVNIAASGHFYKRGLTLIPAWISNYIHYNVWDEITYPFLNFNGATVEV